MSDATKFVKQVLQCCEEAGWSYRATRRGYIITPPGGDADPITIAKNPGDHRGMENARALLRRAGLFAAAEAAEKQRKADARASAASDQPSAQRRSATPARATARKVDEPKIAYGSALEEEIAKRATARVVAGFLREYHVALDPEMCQRILDHNGNPRPLSEKRALDLAAEMERGAWEQTHQGIGLSDDGTLVDGQHRLEAATLAGFTLHCRVTFGLTRQATAAIDSGTKRSTHDAIAYAHDVPFTQMHSSICQALLGHRANGLTSSRLYAFYLTVQPQVEQVIEWFKMASTGRRSRLGSPSAGAAFVRALIGGEEEARLHECVTAWITGEGDMGSHLRRMRDRTLAGEYPLGSITQRAQFCMNVQHWIRHWLDGEQKSLFRPAESHTWAIPSDTGLLE